MRLIAVILWLAGCGGDDEPVRDAMPDARGDADAAGDRADPMPDAEPDADARPADADASADADGDAMVGDDSVLLVAGVVISPERIYATSFAHGEWAPATMIADGGNPTQGGVGVAMLADGRGVAAMRASSGFRSAIWTDGTWAMSTAVDEVVPIVGRMVRTPTGAAIAHWTFPDQALSYDVFDATTSMWTLDDDTGARGVYRSPSVSYIGDGDPFVVFLNSEALRYEWTRRTGGTWSAIAQVPVTLTASTSQAAQIDIVRRTGVDEIVAVFWTSDNTLAYSMFTSGAWSLPTMIATDSSATQQDTTHTSLAALPDGRVALAYWTNTGAIKVGFFDGDEWSDFTEVPDARAEAFSPVAIARGIGGAVAEVLYSRAPDGDQAFELMHTRLIDEGAWTWTEPDVVEGEQRWATIAVSTSP